ncbi:MAG: hypothetical protein H7832_08075 [Magnetococcus sp. DMHC-6]
MALESEKTMNVSSALSTILPQANEAKSLYSDGSDTSADALQTDFLKLLTTQLQYQDPLEPMENTDFTSQLAQFSSLSAQQKSNDLLNKLLTSMGGSNLSQAVSYIGSNVVSEGNQTTVKEGEADVMFELGKTSDVTIALYDASGTEIQRLDPQTYHAGEWNVKLTDLQQADGIYSFKAWVEGDSSAVTTLESGIVTGVINGANGTELNIGGRTVALENIRRVEQANS